MCAACVQVGTQFVNQYYTVMKSTPKYLHRFYTDVSTFTFHDPGHGSNPSYSFTAKSQKVSLLRRGSACGAAAVHPTVRSWAAAAGLARVLLSAETAQLRTSRLGARALAAACCAAAAQDLSWAASWPCSLCTASSCSLCFNMRKIAP